MQKRITVVLSGLFLLVSSINAQSYQPISFVRAVEAGTRTQSGVPGKAYFQNHTDYTMKVEFEPSNGRLRGTAEMVYHNESPDTLRRVVIRLYHNFLKEGGIRDVELPAEVIYEGVTITSLGIDGADLTNKLKKVARVNGTNMSLILPQALSPSAEVRLSITWELLVPPEDVHRFGKYDEGSYFIAYWYPQISVYDDIDGWDIHTYNGTQEFYNDFNSYDVQITVPGKHMVWASGEWLNPEEILSESCLKLYREAGESDETIQIISQENINGNSWSTNKKKKTFHFRFDSIPDFAFAVSDSYLWDSRSTIVDSVTARRVRASAVYPKGTDHFNKVADIGARAINHMSFSSYGLPYPYPGVTVFNGEGGMEFPMMVNDGETFMLNGTVFVTMHEIAHAYFPFLTGLNERKYAWMDEGLTTYLPAETEEFLGSDYFPLSKMVMRYEQFAGSDYDVPLGISSYNTRDIAYFFHTYARPAIAFHLLEDYLGQEVFRTAIRDFISVWQYKHPTPNDFFSCIKNHSPKDLDWLIDEWFYKQGWPDLAIENVELTDDTLSLVIRNKGSIVVPAELKLEFTDGDPEVIRYSADTWKEDKVLALSLPISRELVSIKLNDKILPDRNRSDNVFETDIY
ncbi:MAG: M1 family metallopeptidase [Bacteroidales bacterium]|nr:M1 family metallopeptidase [Bacteroidales bacterium]